MSAIYGKASASPLKGGLLQTRRQCQLSAKRGSRLAERGAEVLYKAELCGRRRTGQHHAVRDGGRHGSCRHRTQRRCLHSAEGFRIPISKLDDVVWLRRDNEFVIVAPERNRPFRPPSGTDLMGHAAL
jgi:hypothetical protein